MGDIFNSEEEEDVDGEEVALRKHQSAQDERRRHAARERRRRIQRARRVAVEAFVIRHGLAGHLDVDLVRNASPAKAGQMVREAISARRKKALKALDPDKAGLEAIRMWRKKLAPFRKGKA